MRPERRNAVKVLMFFDIGGSMDSATSRRCEELFSAARAEFKHMEYFYFHNCLYEGVWKQNNRRRHAEVIPTWDVLHKYGARLQSHLRRRRLDVAPTRSLMPGGSVEHWNPEPGAIWLRRVLDQWPNAVWLNPTQEKHWGYTSSIKMISEIFANRMYPLTLAGLEAATRQLSRKH
jgi:uncharacterized protein with von Willebrand factor type A (vWA) domain